MCCGAIQAHCGAPAAGRTSTASSVQAVLEDAHVREALLVVEDRAVAHRLRADEVDDALRGLEAERHRALLVRAMTGVGGVLVRLVSLRDRHAVVHPADGVAELMDDGDLLDHLR